MTGEEFDNLYNQEPSISIQELRNWVLGKWAVLGAEKATLEAAGQATTGDQLDNGLKAAKLDGKLEVLKDLEQDLVQPHTEAE